MSLSGEERVIRTLDELRVARKDESAAGVSFDVTGEIHGYYPDFLGTWMYSIHDGTNGCTVSEVSVPGKARPDSRAYQLLDRVRFSGRIAIVENRPRAVFERSELISRGNPDAIPEISIEKLMTGTAVGQLVRVSGRVREALRDDTDPKYILLTLHDSGEMAHVMVHEPPQFAPDFTSLIGAEVTATGGCADHTSGLHRYFGPYLTVSGLENITVRSKPDTFSTAPDISELSAAHPRQLASTGYHRAEGSVMAVWGGHNLLMRLADGQLSRVRLQSGPAPSFGDSIRVMGLPVTDSFNINLIHAGWEPTVKAEADPEAAVDMKAGDLMLNEHGFPKLVYQYYGKAVRITGIVRYAPDVPDTSSPMRIESDGQIVSVDMTTLQRSPAAIGIGCRLSVSGICVLDLNSTDSEPGASISDRFLLVPRTAEDVVVLSRPPWWTPGRLVALLGVFATALLGVIGWNVSLNRRAKRKGVELAAEQLAHVTSELKVNERTRLAVELHDALSQTLTGVSMQIDTAAGIVKDSQPTATKCLELASRTIDSCRMELRNTIWDLRSEALDEPDMNTAIRRTLCKNLKNVDLAVRCDIPRRTFSDNTAYAILKIIRELTANSIRHGKATSIRIAGAVEGDLLLFSVKDNGCGFDPDLAPGICEGHFGLQGIAERLERLRGKLTIESSIGKGARVAFSLPVHPFIRNPPTSG